MFPNTKEEEKEMNREYKELYGYSLEQIQDHYEQIQSEAMQDPQKLADFNYIHLFSDKYETPLYQYFNRDAILTMISNYIHGDEGYFTDEADQARNERMQKMDKYLTNSGKLHTVIDKRAVDWIIRQQKVTRIIQDAIITMTESNYKPTSKQVYNLKINLHNAGIRYKESQLDMITFKAVRKLLPSFEMELFIKKYNQNIPKLMEQWNKHNEIYYSHSKRSVGVYATDRLDIADKLYTTKFQLLKSDFYKNIDTYSGEFLSSKVFTRSIFTVGDVYDKEQ